MQFATLQMYRQCGSIWHCTGNVVYSVIYIYIYIYIYSGCVYERIYVCMHALVRAYVFMYMYMCVHQAHGSMSLYDDTVTAISARLQRSV